ncbi:hypothetical protein CBOM_07617 [Ceraceosorus bombacis]|uniref:Uncharacterized protein n=1 Tax=Ceraceosorus bombacis TaxID=401625 RepID=A0A0P1BAI1_9BASI|nr:hypothetical protein CBOM_07617 [Ceraceosorus bombacis]
MTRGACTNGACVRACQHDLTFHSSLASQTQQEEVIHLASCTVTLVDFLDGGERRGARRKGMLATRMKSRSALKFSLVISSYSSCIAFAQDLPSFDPRPQPPS